MKDFQTYTKDYSKFKNNEDRLNLAIREDKLLGIYVEGLSEHVVENTYDCLNLLKKSESNRKVRNTSKNELSSRSHTIFVLHVEKGVVDKSGSLKVICD